jgi:hypothetical protein
MLNVAVGKPVIEVYNKGNKMKAPAKDPVNNTKPEILTTPLLQIQT